MPDRRPSFDRRPDAADRGQPLLPARTDGEERSWWPVASSSDRLVQAVLAVGAWAAIVVAVHLQPSPAGLGTHEQLGFQPCAFYQMTGRPCPGCGLTTAFAHMAHGHPVRAAIIQPFGAVLFLVALAVAAGATVTALAGRSWNLVLLRINAPAWLYSLAFLALASWIYKIAYGRIAGCYGL